MSIDKLAMQLVERHPTPYEIVLRDNISQGDERTRRICAVLSDALRDDVIVKGNDNSEKIEDNGID